MVVIVTFKRELVNGVSEIVMILVLQIGNEIMHMVGMCLERTTGREVEVAYDFVDTGETCHVASFIGLLMDLVCPAFLNTLSKIKF
jgi:hypothetical protein